jgi:hypothetical protein
VVSMDTAFEGEVVVGSAACLDDTDNHAIHSEMEPERFTSYKLYVITLNYAAFRNPSKCFSTINRVNSCCSHSFPTTILPRLYCGELRVDLSDLGEIGR